MTIKKLVAEKLKAKPFRDTFPIVRFSHSILMDSKHGLVELSRRTHDATLKDMTMLFYTTFIQFFTRKYFAFYDELSIYKLHQLQINIYIATRFDVVYSLSKFNILKETCQENIQQYQSQSKIQFDDIFIIISFINMLISFTV